MDVVLLSRIQFALTIMFHYIFPPLTIGMGIVLIYLDWKWVRTGSALYESAARFWTRIFALNFAIGVATGIVMEFEFGTNWATYSRFVGDVFGSALAAEGIFAFFLESGFLAVLVFGWDRVSPQMHFFSTCMVALGAVFSAVWIVIANSWQQTPAGHHIVPILRDGKPWVVDGETMMRAEIVDFWAMVFNPSTVNRLSHTLIGCFIMGAFFIMSISAWYVLKNRHLGFAKHSFRGALVLATVASLAALLTGHRQGNTVYRTQPAKLAAFEGHFETGRGDLSLFGLPDSEAQKLRGNISLPGILSFLLFEDTDRSVVGLDRFRPEDRPLVGIPFATYHVMIALGFFFIALTLYGSLQLWRGKLFRQRWLLWFFVFGSLGAVLANQAGWVAAEVGRQPWIVHPPVEWSGSDLVVDSSGFVEYDETQGLRTTEAVSRAISAEQVLGSLIMFSLIYVLLGAVWVWVLNNKIQKGPEPPEELERRRRKQQDLLGAAGYQGSLTGGDGGPGAEARS
jgi:cytochrome d ubiquinol oxidase subunit I